MLIFFKRNFKIIIFTVLITLGMLITQPSVSSVHNKNINSINSSSEMSSVSSSGTLLDFETAPSGGDLNNYSNYVFFQFMWSRVDVSTNTTFPPHSGSYVLQSSFNMADMNFTYPMEYVSFFFLYHNPTSYTIKAFDHDGSTLQAINVTTPDIYQNITFAYHDIRSISVYGSAFGFNLDDLNFRNDQSQTINSPTFLRPSLNQTISSWDNISWYPAIDQLNYMVYYNLSMTLQSSPYSTFELASRETYNWVVVNTSIYEDGYYLLNLTSYDYLGLSTNVITYFFINNTSSSSGGGTGTNTTDHTLLAPIIQTPTNHSTVTGTFSFIYSPAIDNKVSSLYYTITLMGLNNSNIYALNYGRGIIGNEINSYLYQNGLYKLIVHVTDTVGLENESSILLTINNGNHFITEPVIEHPMANSTYSGIFETYWDISFDSLNHTVYYNLSLKSETSTIDLLINSTLWYYYLNTTEYSNGYYELVLTYYDGFGFAKKLTRGFFINNPTSTSHYITVPVFGSPYNGSIVSGKVEFTYAYAIDSQGLSFTNNVTLTKVGTSETKIIMIANSGTVGSELDTTHYLNGHYILKVVVTDTSGLVNASSIIIIINNGNHFITKPYIYEPVLNNSYSGIIHANWSSAIDNLGHTVNYNLSLMWINQNMLVTYIVLNTQTNYDLNTTLFNNGYYDLVLTYFDNSGLVYNLHTGFYISNPTNAGPYITRPFITKPTAGSTVSGTFAVEWSTSIDSAGNAVFYNLSLTKNNSTKTSFFYSGNANGIEIDSTKYLNGEYILEIIAYDSNGLSNYSSILFSIDNGNHYLTTPTFYYPILNFTYSGFLNISWTRSIDNLIHTVRYNLTLYWNQGTNFVNLLTASVYTFYMLNTTMYQNGFYELRLSYYDGVGLSKSISNFFYISNPIVTLPTISSSTTSLTSSSSNASSPGFELFLGIGVLILLSMVNRKRKR